MSALFTFKRTKGGATHYVASTIPKTTVIDKFTDDPVKAATFKENDAKALFAALESDAKVYGRWAAIDADGREVSVFTHATPEPVVPKPRDLGPLPTVAEVTVGRMATTTPAADMFLADEPDASPFRELAEQFDSLDGIESLGDLATAAAAEMKALRESLDELTAPPKDDDTVLVDENK